MTDKKYRTIKEVSELLQIPDYTLRYIEKMTRGLRVHKIRGRRYYTQKDIDIIREIHNERRSKV